MFEFKFQFVHLMYSSQWIRYLSTCMTYYATIKWNHLLNQTIFNAFLFHCVTNWILHWSHTHTHNFDCIIFYAVSQRLARVPYTMCWIIFILIRSTFNVHCSMFNVKHLIWTLNLGKLWIHLNEIIENNSYLVSSIEFSTKPFQW